MKTVYIAGKVTGLPYLPTVEKFNQAEQRLSKAGYKVVNPMKIVPEETTWQDAMKTCVAAISQCDCIYMLHDWKQSEGAVMELETALRLGLTVVSSLTFDNGTISEELKTLTQTKDQPITEFIYEPENETDMTKEEKNKFLERGGILLRAGLDRNGSPIIKQRTLERDWHTRATFTRERNRDNVLESLLENQESLMFQIDQ